MNNLLVLKHAIKEFEQRKKNQNIDWSIFSFAKQWEFITSKSKRKALQCSRRGGKTSGVIMDILMTMIAKPGTSTLYLAKTRASAKRIVVKDILIPMAKKLGINLKQNIVELSYTMPNGSVLYLGGADQNKDEILKLLGQAYSYVAIDEAAFFKHDLREMVHATLIPAMSDYDGTITLLSTTSNLLGTFYHKIVTGEEPGWDVFKWGWEDNPHMKDKVQVTVDDLIKANPDIVNDPLFRQHFLNEWCIDKSLLVYSFSENNNVIDRLPAHKFSDQEWKYILGVDLGWNDDTSFSLMCYREYDDTLYVVESYKKPGLDFTDTANFIKKYVEKHDCLVVVDGANKQGVQEMINRHQISLEIAEKSAKHDYIELMNADFLTGKIKILAGDKTKMLREEYAKLVWDAEKRFKGKLEEEAKCANHLCDATLYGWRLACNYIIDPEPDVELQNSWDHKLDQKLGMA